MEKPIFIVRKACNKYRENSIYVSYTSLILVASGLFLSRAMISIGFLLFVLNWIVEADYRIKWKLFKENKSSMIVSLIVLIHLAGMAHTENVAYGISELKIKLPLLLPVFFLSSPKLHQAFNKNIILAIYILSAFIASIYGFFRFGISSQHYYVEDLHLLAVLGQNIQVSVFMVFAAACTVYFIVDKDLIRSKIQKTVLGIVLIWFVIYIYLLNSYTGYITFTILLIYTWFSLIKNKVIRNISLLVFILAGLSFSIYLSGLIKGFTNDTSTDLNTLPEKTANGNFFQHDTLSKRTENGYLVDIYICTSELEKEWEKVSGLPFNGRDNKQQELKETIVRYMSSKGLSKDSVGLALLSTDDIRFIEQGCANIRYTKKYSLESRIYQVYWQLKTYRETGNSTAQSFSQRIDFFKAAFHLIRNNFWFGVGTGDVMDSFKQILAEKCFKLDPSHFNRVHNQYIVELASLGIFGFIAFMLIILLPIFQFKIWKSYLFTSFYLIVLLSFFTDNPLETQLGVSFFILFHCVLFLETRLFIDTNPMSTK